MAVSFRDLLKPTAVDDVEAAKRRQALAEAMYAKHMSPNIPQAGGPVQAKYGVGNALVDLANSLAGAWNLKNANEGLRGAENARASALMDATTQLQGAVPDAQVGEAAAARIKAAPDGQLAEPVYGTTESQQKVAKAMGPGGAQALADALLKQSLTKSDPEFQANVAMKNATLAASMAERRSQLEQRILDREQRAADAAATREQRAEAAREAADLRRELMGLQKYIADQASADRRYAVDNRPDPNKAKADAAREKADGAKQTVSSLVGELGTYYDDLEKGGGIVSTESGPIGNLAAAVQSSGVGQTVGGALGTTNQSARNSINMMRPRLVSAIMAATGMSAKQLDSNTELKLALDAATDPKKDVQANRRALAWIEQNYGLGGAPAPAGGAPAAPAPPGTPPAGGPPAVPQAPAPPSGGAPQPRVFKSEDEVAAANLPDGTPVIVNGVRGTWRH